MVQAVLLYAERFTPVGHTEALTPPKNSLDCSFYARVPQERQRHRWLMCGAHTSGVR